MKLKEIIHKALNMVSGEDNFVVERPNDENRGDFASSLALGIAKKSGENPRELAEKWRQELDKDVELMKVVDRVEVAGSGFLNFWIRDSYIALGLEVIDQSLQTFYEPMKGKKVLVEYSSPNIAKRFSVGHLRSTIIGQAIFNFYKACGAKVTNDNHLGDWGTQFGMIIAAVEEEKLVVSEMTISDLEDLYVRFNRRLEDYPNLRDKAKEAFLRLENGDMDARKIWKESVDISMKEFDEIYSRLGVSFEHAYGESYFEESMSKIIEIAKNTGVAVDGENGAVIVKFEKDGKEYMSPAMLVKGDGTTTYFTRDLATIWQRITEEELISDLYIYEVGGEQRLHMRQVFETAKKLWPKETKGRDFVHVAHGLLSLPEGKMSTRKGNTVKLEDLLGRASEEAKDKAEGKYNEKVSSQMGINAVKYNELKRSPGMDYVFLWEEALSMSGNSAPYINYAYVRARKMVINIKELTVSKPLIFEGEEKELARFLMRYLEGEVVQDAANNFGPQILSTYLFELAKRFNGFYDRNKVLGDTREKERVVLVSGVGKVLKHGMNLLGIEMVKEM